jgi:hypothetical protein
MAADDSAVFSQRVVMRRKCLILLNKRPDQIALLVDVFCRIGWPAIWSASME